MELSKEHFESYLKLQLDTQTTEIETEIKGYIHKYVQEAFEAQQVYLDARFKELVEAMQIKERLDQHEYWIDKIAGKVGMTLENTN